MIKTKEVQEELQKLTDELFYINDQDERNLLGEKGTARRAFLQSHPLIIDSAFPEDTLDRYLNAKHSPLIREDVFNKLLKGFEFYEFYERCQEMMNWKQAKEILNLLNEK